MERAFTQIVALIFRFVKSLEISADKDRKKDFARERHIRIQKKEKEKYLVCYFRVFRVFCGQNLLVRENSLAEFLSTCVFRALLRQFVLNFHHSAFRAR
jgi:hypothetical protein